MELAHRLEHLVQDVQPVCRLEEGDPVEHGLFVTGLDGSLDLGEEQFEAGVAVQAYYEELLVLLVLPIAEEAEVDVQ